MQIRQQFRDDAGRRNVCDSSEQHGGHRAPSSEQPRDLAAHQSDEIILLTTFGAVLLVGGVAQRLQVSAAIGAFLVGIALSGPLAHRSQQLLAPLRDLFAATFFFFFGLEIDPASLIPALPFAAVLAIVTAATKAVTG
jgi:K+:H+ antiporter subunit KhtU